MEDVLKHLGEQPILLAACVFLLGGVMFFALRNVFRLMAIVALGTLILAGFYYAADVEKPKAVSTIQKDAGEALQRGVKKAREAGQRLGENLGSEVKKAARSQLESFRDGSR